LDAGKIGTTSITLLIQTDFTAPHFPAIFATKSWPASRHFARLTISLETLPVSPHPISRRDKARTGRYRTSPLGFVVMFSQLPALP
jgi:hypothetical protein